MNVHDAKNAGHKWFIFLRNSYYYAIEIQHVAEVLQLSAFISAPISLRGCVGFCSFRGTLVPVVDIEKLVDQSFSQEAPLISPLDNSKSSYIVTILNIEGILIGLILDKFIETSEILLNSETDSDQQRSNPFIESAISYRSAALSKIKTQSLRELASTCQAAKPLAEKSDFSRQDTPSHQQIMDLLCIKISDTKIGIPLSNVVEIIEGFSVSPLFRVSKIIRGLINLRGQIIPCVDISESLGLPVRKLLENNKFVILRFNERDLALCVDSVSKIFHFQQELFQDIDSTLSESNAEFLGGIIEAKPERVFMLCVDSIFNSKHIVQYAEAI